MNKHHIWSFFLEDPLNFLKNTARNIEKSLTGLHDCKVKIGLHVKDMQNLLKHLSMLASHNNNGTEVVRARFKHINKWTHLNCFRTSSENQHYLFHYNNQPLNTIGMEDG